MNNQTYDSITGTKNEIKSYFDLISKVNDLEHPLVHKDVTDLVSQISLASISLYNKKPHLVFSLLNLRVKNLNYLANLLLKVNVFAVVSASSLGYTEASTRQFLNTCMYITIHNIKLILDVKKEKVLSTEDKKALFLAARSTFRAFKAHLTDSPNEFRLLSQLASVNEFKRKNQISQGLVITTLNAAIYALPIIPIAPLNARKAFTKALNLTNLISPKPFIRTLSELRNILNINLDFAQLMQTSEGNDAYFVNTTLKDEVVLLPSDSPVGENLVIQKRSKIRFVYSQKVANFEDVLNKLCEFDVPMNNVLKCQPLAVAVDNYEPSGSLVETAQALLSETNNAIAEFLSKDFYRCQLLLNYAQENTKTTKPISTVKHAVSMLGLVRIYPVICISEMRLKSNSVREIGDFEVNNKETTFAKIAKHLSLGLKTDIPEYIELLARLLFQGLMTLPKSRFVASTSALSLSKKVDDVNLSLNHVLGGINLNSWHKSSLKLARSWQLPKRYNASLNLFFEIKGAKLTLNNIPNSTQPIITTLLLSEWLFLQCLSGTLPTRYESIAGLLKSAEISHSKFNELAADVINDAKPTCSLL